MKQIYTLCLIFLISNAFCHAQEWDFVKKFPRISNVEDLSVGKDGIVYAYTTDRHIFHSSDFGNTWEPFVSVTPYLNILGIKASEVSNRVFGPSLNFGVTYTDDFGASWHNDNIITQPTSGHGLAITKIDIIGNTVIAVSGEDLYKSNANGSEGTWSLLYNGVQGVFILDVFYISPTHVFIPTGSNGLPTGLKRSTNGGITFTNIPFFNNQLVTGVVEDGSGNLYTSANDNTTGKVYQSIDNGLTWSSVLSIPGDPFIYGLDYSPSGNLLYAVTENGVYRKAAAGSWNLILDKEHLSTMELDDSNTIYVSGKKSLGVDVSNTQTIHFENKSFGVGIPEWFTISGTKMMTGNYSTTAILGTTTSATSNWEAFDMQTLSNSENAVGSLGATIRETGEIVVGGKDFIVEFDQNFNSTVLTDANNGPFQVIAYVNFLGSNVSTVADRIGVFFEPKSPGKIPQISTDNGLTWTSELNPYQNDPNIFILDYEMGQEDYFVLATDLNDGELMWSQDATNWTSITLPGGLNTFGLDKSKTFLDRNDTLYLLLQDATQTLKLYRLDLQSQNWTEIGFDLSTVGNGFHFELIFNEQNHLYILTYNTDPELRGIYISQDQGETWVNYDFPTVNGETVLLKDLGISTEDKLFARSANKSIDLELQGIYSLDETTLQNPDITIADKVIIYPNPVTESVNIVVPAKASFKLNNLKGQNILEGVLNQGNNNLSLPHLRLSGIYVVEIFVENTFISKKILFK
jgi:hypothetical protein